LDDINISSFRKVGISPIMQRWLSQHWVHRSKKKYHKNSESHGDWFPLPHIIVQ
jgi:hypothetical protein